MDAPNQFAAGSHPLGFFSNLVKIPLPDADYPALHLKATRVDHNGAILHAWTEILSRFSMACGNTSLLIRLIGRDDYYIVPECIGIDTNEYLIVDRCLYEAGESVSDDSTVADGGELQPAYIRRPRNSFILYRIWKCSKIAPENPELTMGTISKVISNMWRAEDLYVKGHFKGLAVEEDRRHKAMYPSYRYGQEVRRRVYLPLSKQNLTQNPMDTAKLLIHDGY